MSLSKITGEFGDAVFSVNEGETYSKTNAITDRPVETGVNIVDNVNVQPDIISFSGIVVGTDAFPKLQLLRKYMNEAILVRYIGRNDVTNAVIQNMDTTHDNKVRNGFVFSMTIKVIRIAVGVTFNFDTTKVVKPKIQVKTNQGKKNKETKTVTGDFDAIQAEIEKRMGGGTIRGGFSPEF